MFLTAAWSCCARSAPGIGSHVVSFSFPYKAQNFHITDDHLGEGGAKTKYAFNIAAIQTLKQIEAEGRQATPQEQETLSKYVGWGGISQAFDEENTQWSEE